MPDVPPTTKARAPLSLLLYLAWSGMLMVTLSQCSVEAPVSPESLIVEARERAVPLLYSQLNQGEKLEMSGILSPNPVRSKGWL